MAKRLSRQWFFELFILLLATSVSLASLVLNGFIAHIAFTLRNRVHIELALPTATISAVVFEKIMTTTLLLATIAAILCSISTIFSGMMLFWYWRRTDCPWSNFIAMRISITLILCVVGVVCATMNQGYEKSFDNFPSYDHLPYYKIVFYGGVAQAVYAPSVVVILGMIYSCKILIAKLTDRFSYECRHLPNQIQQGE